MKRLTFFIKPLFIFSAGMMVFLGTALKAPGASNNRKSTKEIPGVETKIKQVPSEGAYTFPLWKIHWEKARQWVLLKKYPEAVQDFQQALTLKPNLDEARQELVQILITLEHWGEAIKELETLAEHHPLNTKVQKELADLLSQKKEYRRANEKYLWLLQKEPDNILLHLSLAANYYQLNEWEKALIEWRQVLIRDPQNVEARTHMADILGATRRVDESILLLEGLVKQFPKQLATKKKLAQALVSARRNKEALPLLQELARQDPSEMEVQLLLAQVLSAGKHYDQSLTYLDTYLKKKPENSSALLEKARALFNTGNHAEGLEVYERLRKMEPQNFDLQREVAEAYFVSGKHKEALGEYENLVKHFPKEYPLYERIGELYYQNKQYRQALGPYQKALSLEPENLFAQLNLARAYNFSGAKEKALPLYRAILAKRNDPTIQIELADLLQAGHHYTEALQVYRQILESQPDSWEVRLKLATGLYQQKEFLQAAKELEPLVEKMPENADIWTLTGYNALAQGNYPQAQKAFQKTLTLGNDRSPILITLGEVWRLQGRPWKGIGYLDWALNIKPNNPDILVEKVMALIDGGGWAQARRMLESMDLGNVTNFKVQRAWFRLMAAQDRRDESEAGWEALEKNFPREQDLIFQDRAEFYSRKKKPEIALTALKAAQIKNPQNMEIRRRIGGLLRQLGQWKEAEEYYQTLEKEQILLDDVYLGQAALLIRQGKTDQAKERLWKAMIKDPDSVKIRFWLWWVYHRETAASGEAKKIEETLLEFSRAEEGGLLELADGYRETGDWKKASEYYQELIDRGEDDDVLSAIYRVSGFFLEGGQADKIQGMLEDLQKRYPRNQKLTRLLMETYTQKKEYALAVKTIDGLLKIEDPLDPVLNVHKARILERWNKHADSQTVYQKLLESPVDLKFKEKVKAIIPSQDQKGDSFYRLGSEKNITDFVNPFYEEAKRKIEFFPLEADQKNKLQRLMDDFKARALIQKKVYLEKEEKDRLWRGQFSLARPYLEALKELDPDNEEVPQDISRSYRSEN